jgi:CRP/FNR family transcriptional regulator
MNSSNILNGFAAFKNPDLKAEIEEQADSTTVKRGSVIIREGQYIRQFCLVVKGSIRVFQRSDDAEREITLYYVHPGETCMMTLAAVFFDTPSPSKAVA